MKKYKVTKEKVSYAIDMLYGVLRIPLFYIIAYLLIAGIFYLAIMEREVDLNYFLSLSATEIYEFNSLIKILAIIFSVFGTIFTFIFANNKCSSWEHRGLYIVTIIIGTFLTIFVVGRFSITGAITYYIVVFMCIRLIFRIITNAFHISTRFFGTQELVSCTEQSTDGVNGSI